MFSGKGFTRLCRYAVVKETVKSRTVDRLIKWGGIFPCAAILALGITGCASTPSELSRHQPVTGRLQTHIISGTVRSDTSAFNRSQQLLTRAGWKVQTQNGPQSVWKKWNTPLYKRSKQAETQGSTEMHALPPDQSQRTSGNGEKATSTDGKNRSRKPIGGGANEKNAEKSKSKAGESIQRLVPVGAKIASLRPGGKALPVTVVKLLDHRVILIWKLRNYGGPTVSVQPDGVSGLAGHQVNRKPTDLSPLVSVIQYQLGTQGNVQALPHQNTLVITCPASRLRFMENLLNKLDVPQPQVELTAEIFEVDNNFDYQQGAKVLLQHISNGNAQSVLSTFDTQQLLQSVAQRTTYQGSLIGMLQQFQSAGVSLNVSVQLLAKSGLLKIIASPRLMVAAGQDGYMLAGEEFPVQSLTVTNNVVTISTQYKPVGTQLYITPQTIGLHRVKLHIVSEVSSISGFTPMAHLSTSKSTTGLVNPVIKLREAQTDVSVKKGDTLVISGLRKVRTFTRKNEIPVLGDIPLLGNLFKSMRSQQQLTDLYFFITPHLIKQ